MKIKDASFAGSSTRISQKPALRLPEFAFIGRSNVGKSSLINMLCGNKKLAKTSSTPGKTRLVNHFRIDNKWYLVDLPGYGFAKISQKERQELTNIIDDFILKSEELMLLFVLIDSRHDMVKNDIDFITRLGQMQVPFSIIFTKADKMGPNALKAQIAKDMEVLKEQWEELPRYFSSSAQTGMGKEEILDYIDDILKKISH
ncbi:MAG: YihA family ribosome biogenesis GTP-binding protein [Bacteroidales bacterium]|jgi:GTP-binding protein|nr:YihA family ribosome biogenesis GTP-binding protein [Bacteroidales bacterium]MDY2934687.1 ribosome biogenesis GTP-binding protein YihA/YsxC [Candidatus Cryptobacteroides sp.]MDD7087957.1 ribosome biogenesis GTP-binding protein YihA/YsxC [Bacteroidales bacterium]MDY6320420.1 ribosome biogenesis GTP-binding protein YihA/YsxC [Bacteroidales bacterium]MDY6377314.1 ribosome biogenesis GTP-binding protein YihA/YsxC [Bacteroidales bacterium]